MASALKIFVYDRGDRHNKGCRAACFQYMGKNEGDEVLQVAEQQGNNKYEQEASKNNSSKQVSTFRHTGSANDGLKQMHCSRQSAGTFTVA